MCPPKPTRITDRVAVVARARRSGHDIEIDLGVEVFQIEGRRYDAVAQGPAPSARPPPLRRRPASDPMPLWVHTPPAYGHRSIADGAGFGQVTEDGSGGMGVDVVDVGRC